MPDSSPRLRVISDAVWEAVIDVVKPFSDTGFVASMVPFRTKGFPSDALMVMVFASLTASVKVWEYLIHAT